MNIQNRLNIISGLLLLLSISFGSLRAEGTKELSPTAADSAMLHTNASGFGSFASFASFGTSSSLNIRITDAVNDSIYIGLSAEADDFGNLNSSYTFRILDPTGAVAFGPFTIGLANDNAFTWALAANGPDVNGMGGYSTNTAPGFFPYSRFKPNMIGDYVVQFDDLGSIANILFYDFTVRNGGSVQPGRLWSRNWALRTPPINPNSLPDCQFDRPFNGVFYSYTMDGFVSRIDFDNSGFQGLSFNVAFGDRGPGNSGDIIADRRSVNDMNATANNADHMVFLNDPDSNEFPSSTAQCGDVALISVSCETPDSFCINIGVTQPGQVEVILDFVNNGLYDEDTTDVLLALFFDVADTLCIPWNGLKGDGSPIGFGEAVPTIIRYSQGVQHYAAFDVEFLKNGFCVQTVRPICPGIATDLLYWDDSQITDDVITVTIDEGDPGTGQPKVQFNGCTCGVGGCRTWDNFQIGDPPTGNCTGTPFGYAENSTLNTWWFASTTVLNNISLPFAQVNITGDSAVCNGDSTVFTADVFPDTLDFIYAWTGPGGFSANTPTTGNIGAAGTYYVTIIDTITNCSATDSAVLIVYANPTTSIDFACLGANQQNADVLLDVASGQAPYTYLWSNGAMTEDLSNVPPGQYSVIVTDANGCQAFDTIVVEGCCELIVTCPPLNGGSFTCADDVPTMNMNVVTIVSFCDDVTISAQETDNGGAGCPGDTLFITRVFTIEDAVGSIATCTQIYTVVDNVEPTVVSGVSDTSIICTDPITTAFLGIPSYTDNCSIVTLTFSDDSTGFNGICTNNVIGVINRTFYGEDVCGNIDSSVVQQISIIDTIAPTFTAPANVTIDCAADLSPVSTGEVLDTVDNCPSLMIVSFNDLVVGGPCPASDTIFRTWLVVDACGNSSTDVQILVLLDTVPPTFTVPDTVTLDCGANIDPMFTGQVTDAADNCSSFSIDYSDLIVQDGCPVNDTVFRTWVVTDACDNSTTGVQVILRVDTDPPTFTTPADTILECGMSTDTIITGSITDAADNCSDITISFSDDVVAGTCPGIDTTFRTWTVIDHCNNSAFGVQTIIRIDTVAPIIVFCPANITIACTDSTDPQSLGTALSTDLCDPTVTITYSDTALPPGCPNGTPINRTWIATDDCGNSSTCLQVISVIDTLPPTFVLPPDLTLACDEDNSPANAGNPTQVSDNCSVPDVDFSDIILIGDCSPFADTVLRTWVITDECGNSSTGLQTIFRVDTVPPTFTVPPQATISCDQDSFPSTTGMVTDTLDNCSNMDITFTDLILPNGCPTQDTIERTWVVTDRCGNSASALQYILRLDQVAPTFTVPADTIVDCGENTLPPFTGDVLDATDNCSDVTVSFDDVTVEGDCPALVVITRTWTAVDQCDNATTAAQIITVQDTTPPTFTTPPAVIIDCDDDINDLNLTGNVSEVTDCSSISDTSYTDVIGIDGCDGTAVIFRTWTVADLCLNTSTGVQMITVQDTLPPVIQVPDDITIECDQNPLDTSITGGMIIFMDNCSMMFGAMFSDDNSGLTGCNGTGFIVRTWLIDDECDNASTMQQVITIVDQTPPTALCQNITLDFSQSNEVTITPDQIDNGSTDNCGDVTLSISQSLFSCDLFTTVSSIPVTLTVTDECGNSSTCIAQVMGIGGLLDIDCPDDIVVYLGPTECVATVNYVVTADAACGGEPTLIQTDTTGLTAGSLFPIGTTIQEWTAFNATDTVSCSFTITVIEYDGPVHMACNDTINVGADANCEVHIFADMILEGDLYTCYDDYIITIEDVGTDTGWIVFPVIDLLDGYYNVTITDPDNGLSCWGVIHIEDKIAPQIVCACPPGDPEADTCQISCLEVELLANGNIPPHLYPVVIENCSYTLEVANIEVDDQGCGEGNVIVTWLATDGSGNSASCDQEFEILPLSADSLVFPPNYVGACGTSSDPDVTGWPQIGGYDLTDQAGLCNLFLGYWDKPLDDCGGGQKILRTWTVLDWCTLEQIEGQQVIKLSDDQGPVLTCPADFTVGTDFWYCYANVSVPKPLAYDVCSPVVGYALTSTGGTIVQFGNNYVLQGLELGTHYITWTVTDLCGNSSTCTFTITVIDDVVPVANCDHHTVVSLTNDGPRGITLVPASVFDDGSYDNCGPVTFRARRMDSCIDFDWTTNGGCIDDVPNGFVNASDFGTSLKPCVPFACCDVPRSGSRLEPIMVELEITDVHGNRNYCMVEVEVQDKIAPFIECPPDIYVSCDYWFPAEEGTYRDAAGNQNGNLDEDPLSSIFGNMFDALTYNDDESVRQPITIFDPGNTQYHQPYTWGYDGWADDNCMADLEVRVRVYDDCSGESLPGNPPPGAVKLIERRFTARDNQDGFTPASCTQRIWVVDFEPFYISDNSCFNPDPNDGVIWPCDILITSCPDQLGGTGEPQIIADACSLIGVTYEDTRFDFADGACFKILREWHVIDWCQYNPVTGYGLWTYTQVIKVNDEQAPEFLACPSSPVVLCVADEGVRLPANNQAFLGESNPNASSCSVHVTLKQRLREACNNEVAYDVKIYPFNGPTFIQALPRTVLPVDENHEVDLVFNTEQSPIQDIRLNGLPYNSIWCGDYHKILWSVEDGCGNWSHCEYLFRLEDCKQPSPVCINGLSTVVMPVGCEITLWAKDFNASSFDDCTPADELLYSFSGDAYEPSKTFNGTNIAAFGVEMEIQIWVADGGTDDNCNSVISWSERNTDYCTTTIIFSDNSDNCDIVGPIFEGIVVTPQDIPVETVKVSLEKDDVPVHAMNTADNGKYRLKVPEINGQRYTIRPERLDQPRNGVSTLDLVRIQKHLLGIELFSTPFQYIAADANNNEQISAIDLVEIRKLILGIYSAYPNNDSWRFVDKNFNFANPQSPWPFEEVINIQYDGSSISGLDFTGVKVGDVNNSVQANATQILPRGGMRVMPLTVVAPESAKAGEMMEVAITFPERVLGFQWTLETEGLAFAGIRSEDIRISDQNVGQLENGILTMSWNNESLQSDQDQVGMTIILQFVSNAGGRVADMIRLSDRVTFTEAYTAEEEMVRLSFASDDEDGADFALYQNEPNPWTNTTSIRFEMPEDGQVTLTLFDMTGKTVKVIEGEYKAGHHAIELSKKDILTQGVLYYRLDSGSYSATKKMIRLE